LLVSYEFTTLHFSHVAEERADLLLSHILWQVVYDEVCLVFIVWLSGGRESVVVRWRHLRCHSRQLKRLCCCCSDCSVESGFAAQVQLGSAGVEGRLPAVAAAESWLPLASGGGSLRECAEAGVVPAQYKCFLFYLRFIVFSLIFINSV